MRRLPTTAFPIAAITLSIVVMFVSAACRGQVPPLPPEKEVLRVRDMLIEAHESFGSDGPSSDVIRRVAQKLAAAGDPKVALEIARTWKLERWDALSVVAVGRTKSGDRAGSARTFEEAVRAATRLPRYHKAAFWLCPSEPRASALAKIAVRQAEAGDIEGATRTAELIRTTYPDPKPRDSTGPFPQERDPCSGLSSHDAPIYLYAARQSTAVAQARAGDVEGALATVGSCSAENEVISAAVSARLDTEDLDGAMHVLSLSKADCLGSPLLGEAFGRTAALAASKGNEEKAHQLAGAAGSAANQARAFALLGAALARGGNSAAAEGAFQYALQAAETVSDPPWKLAELVKLARAQAKAGRTDLALNTLHQAMEPMGPLAMARAQKKAGRTDFSLEQVHEVAYALAEAGAFEDGVELALQLRNDGEPRPKFWKIIETQALSGDIEGAAKNASLLPKPERHDALLALVRVHAQRGELQDAFAWLQRTDSVDRSYGLVAIAEGMLDRRLGIDRGGVW